MKQKLFLALTTFFISPIILHYASTQYLALETFTISKTYQLAHFTLHTAGLQPIPSSDSINTLIDRSADAYGLQRPLLHALAVTESQKNPAALSLKGAIGVVQVMPDNYKRCGLIHAGRLWDEATNIDCGAKILSQEIVTYKGNVLLALKAYSGGNNCVKNRCPESEQYVSRILTNIGTQFVR